MKYKCDVCGYEYDPEKGDPDNGIAPGTPWEEVPEDWVCPLCSVGKDQFSEADQKYIGLRRKNPAAEDICSGIFCECHMKLTNDMIKSE